MTKPERQILERIFASEINNELPYQFGRREPKVVLKLEREGYVRRLAVTLPGRFLVRVEGWQLTLRGHVTYCSGC